MFTPSESECENKEIKEQVKETKEKNLNIKEIFAFASASTRYE